MIVETQCDRGHEERFHDLSGLSGLNDKATETSAEAKRAYAAKAPRVCVGQRIVVQGAIQHEPTT